MNLLSVWPTTAASVLIKHIPPAIDIAFHHEAVEAGLYSSVCPRGERTE